MKKKNNNNSNDNDNNKLRCSDVPFPATLLPTPSISILFAISTKSLVVAYRFSSHPVSQSKSVLSLGTSCEKGKGKGKRAEPRRAEWREVKEEWSRWAGEGVATTAHSCIITEQIRATGSTAKVRIFDFFF